MIYEFATNLTNISSSTIITSSYLGIPLAILVNLKLHQVLVLSIDFLANDRCWMAEQFSMQIGNWFSLEGQMASITYPPLHVECFFFRVTANYMIKRLVLTMYNDCSYHV